MTVMSSNSMKRPMEAAASVYHLVDADGVVAALGVPFRAAFTGALLRSVTRRMRCASGTDERRIQRVARGRAARRRKLRPRFPRPAAGARPPRPGPTRVVARGPPLRPG